MSKISYDEETEAQRSADEKILRLQEIEDVKTILATQEGMRFFRRLFAYGKPFADPYTGNSQTFYNCGFQKFSRALLADIIFCGNAEQLKNVIKQDEGVDDQYFPKSEVQSEEE